MNEIDEKGENHTIYCNLNRGYAMLEQIMKKLICVIYDMINS